MGNMKTRLPLMLHCSQVSLPFPSADGLNDRQVITAEPPESMKSLFQYMMWDPDHKDPLPGSFVIEVILITVTKESLFERMPHPPAPPGLACHFHMH